MERFCGFFLLSFKVIWEHDGCYWACFISSSFNVRCFFFFATTLIHPVVGIVQMRSLHPCMGKWEIVYIRTHIQGDKIIPEIMGQAE